MCSRVFVHLRTDAPSLSASGRRQKAPDCHCHHCQCASKRPSLSSRCAGPRLGNESRFRVWNCYYSETREFIWSGRLDPVPLNNNRPVASATIHKRVVFLNPCRNCADLWIIKRCLSFPTFSHWEAARWDVWNSEGWFYQPCKHHSAFASAKTVHFLAFLIRRTWRSIWMKAIWPSSADMGDVKELLSDRILTLTWKTWWSAVECVPTRLWKKLLPSFCALYFLCCSSHTCFLLQAITQNAFQFFSRR